MNINDPALLNIDLEYAANLTILLNTSSVSSHIRDKKIVEENDNHVYLPARPSEDRTTKKDILRNEPPNIIIQKQETLQNVRVPIDTTYSENSTLNEISMDTSEDSQLEYKINVKETAKLFQNPIQEKKHKETQNLNENQQLNNIHNMNLTKSISITSKVLGPRIRSLSAHFQIDKENDFKNKYQIPGSARMRSIPKNVKSRDETSPEYSKIKKTAEECFGCHQIVYPTDRVSPGNHVYHSQCLRCCVCERILTISMCETSKDKLYCHPHFLETIHGIKRSKSEINPAASGPENSKFTAVNGGKKIYNLGNL